MGRKKKGKKNKKSGDGIKWLQIEGEIISSVLGVILIAFALILALAYFGVAKGLVAEWAARSLSFLFGAGAFIFPIVLFAASLYILVSHKPKVISSAFLGGALMFLSLLGLVDIFGKNDNHIGGLVGYLFTWPFMRSIGFWGSFVLFAAFFVSGILITFRIPLRSYAREILRPGEYEDEEETEIVIERGLVRTIADAARKIRPKRAKQEMLPAEETMSVNLPPTSDDKTKSKSQEIAAFSVIPASKDYKFPPLDLLERESGSPVSGDIKANALIIQKTLENFGIPVEMAEVNVGPSVTQFTLKPATGIKLSRLTVLQNDLALALAAHPIRIEAPIPGKSLVGIEIPNKKSMVVRLKDMLETFNKEANPEPLNIALGRDVAGNAYWTTLTSMPHLLVAGATGTGKSVSINAILMGLLFRHSPEVLRLILVDPKRVELTLYDGIPHLLTPVITKPKKAIAALRWAVSEMERRYEDLLEERVRDIQSYNTAMKKKKGEFMPYIVIVIDELADLMAAYGREMEGAIVRLAQMARAVGIHLVVSTQRPSVEVITGLIKANITSRVAFQVASQVDSRTILDLSGAEKLLGMGDMLYIGSDFSKPKRFQGTFVSEKEVKRVVSFLKKHSPAPESSEEGGDEFEDAIEEKGKSSPIDLDDFDEDDDFDDDLYPEAKELVIQAKKASASLLQRRLRVGYARAARLLDMLEDRDIVGPADGAKPREVYIGDAEGIEREDKEEGEDILA